MWKRRSSPSIGLVLAFLAGCTTNATAHSNFLAVTATFQTETERNRPMIKKRKKTARYQKGNWFRVVGYADSRFFYGQLQLLSKGKVAGYLYRPKKDQFYVYGEITRSGIIRVFDNQGVLYRLVIENQTP